MSAIRPEVAEMLVDAELMLNRFDNELERAMDGVRSYAPTAEPLGTDESLALDRLFERLRAVKFEAFGCGSRR